MMIWRLIASVLDRRRQQTSKHEQAMPLFSPLTGS